MSVQSGFDTEFDYEPEPASRSAVRIWIARLILVVGVAFGVLACIYLWRPAILLGTPTKVVAYSVAAETTSTLFRSSADCKRIGGDRFECWMPDSTGSGSASYVVTMGKRGCWKARQAGDRTLGPNNGPMPETASDCLSPWDWERVWNVI